MELGNEEWIWSVQIVGFLEGSAEGVVLGRFSAKLADLLAHDDLNSNVLKSNITYPSKSAILPPQIHSGGGRRQHAPPRRAGADNSDR